MTAGQNSGPSGQMPLGYFCDSKIAAGGSMESSLTVYGRS